MSPSEKSPELKLAATQVNVVHTFCCQDADKIETQSANQSTVLPPSGQSEAWTVVSVGQAVHAGCLCGQCDDLVLRR